MSDDNKRIKWSVIGLGIVCLMLFGLGCSFFPVWRHKHEDGAEAYGAFLQFVAASLSTIITLIYVYYTRKALTEAQRANRRQWKEWQQKVTVKPKFWIAYQGSRNWHLTVPGTNRLNDLGVYLGFVCVVWNYSEQSVLIESIRVERVDVPIGALDLTAIRKVLKPHTDESFDITGQVMSQLSKMSQMNLVAGTLDSEPDESGQFRISLTYTDWQHSEALSDTFDVTLVREGDIRHPRIRFL